MRWLAQHRGKQGLLPTWLYGSPRIRLLILRVHRNTVTHTGSAWQKNAPPKGGCMVYFPVLINSRWSIWSYTLSSNCCPAISRAGCWNPGIKKPWTLYPHAKVWALDYNKRIHGPQITIPYLLQHWTLNPLIYTLQRAPVPLNPKQFNLHPATSTLNTRPRPPTPHPCAQNPAPEPCTLHPTPEQYPPHPIEYLRRSQGHGLPVAHLYFPGLLRLQAEGLHESLKAAGTIVELRN